MTEAGHLFALMVDALAGESLPAIPPATSTHRTHHADGFSPAIEKHLARIFGDEDRVKFKPIDPKTYSSTRTRWTPEKEARRVFQSLLRASFGTPLRENTP